MRFAVILPLSLLLPASVAAQSVTAPSLGDRAPEFALPAATRDSVLHNPVSLTALRASGPVVVAFYPADWSGGCTKEMCTFRDTFSELGSLGVTVVGISGDYVYSHRAWAKELNLPFKLLSDHNHAVASAYGCFNAGTGFNIRSVVVVDRNGAIAYVDRSFTAGSEESYRALSTALQGIPR